MIALTPPEHIDTIERVAHRRDARTALLTTVVPSSVMLLLYLGTGSTFILFPIVLFVAVGVLNDYLTESRPVPRALRISPDGVREETREGLVREHGWADLHSVREHLLTVRGRHRAEVYLHDGRAPLYLYPQAMRLTTCNGEPDAGRFSEQLVVTGIRWGRPVTYARHLIARQVPGFLP